MAFLLFEGRGGGIAINRGLKYKILIFPILERWSGIVNTGVIGFFIFVLFELFNIGRAIKKLLLLRFIKILCNI